MADLHDNPNAPAEPQKKHQKVVGAREEDGMEFRKGGDHDISHGPVKKRHCTDILFCLLFIAHWVGIVIVASIAFSTGNPNRLVAGRDFEGAFCGLDSSIQLASSLPESQDASKDAFPRLYFTLNLTSLPDDFDFDNQAEWDQVLNITKFTTYFSAVCVKTCPCFDDSATDFTTKPKCPSGSEKANTPREFTHKGQSLFALSKEFCPYDPEYCLPVKTDPVPIFDRYCIPQLGGANQSARAYVPEGLLDSWTSFIGDIRVVWPVLAAVCGIALVLGMLYLLFIRFCADVLVWIGLIGSIAMFGVGGWACWHYSEQVEGDSNQKALWVLGIVVWSLGGIFLLLTLCLCNQIRTGIAIVKTAAMFIYNVPTILFMPLIFFALICALYCVWVIVALYIMSAVTEEEVAGKARYSWNENTQRVFAYHAFSLLWNNAFLIGLNQMIVAGTVASWYFTAPNDAGRKIPLAAVCTSLKNTLVYHTGSVAFGSMILAIVQLIRWFLSYLSYQAQHAKANPGTACAKCAPCGIGTACAALPVANIMWSKILMCLAYLVGCFERCIKFLNKNAYIQVAILGKNFCRSAYAAFCLILRNIFRISVLGLVGRGLRFLGMVAIVLAATLSGFFIMEAWRGDLVSSPTFPVLVFIGASWVIAATIMDVLAMSIDTTLQCFVADEEMSGKGEGGEYTPPPLRAVLDDPTSREGCCGCCRGGSSEKKPKK